MKTGRINTLLGVSVLLTITSAIITHYAARESSERVDIILKTGEVVRISESIISQLRESEIYYRDFLLFHDATRAENFHRTTQEIEDNIHLLRSNVADSAQIHLLETTIVPVVQEKLSRLRASINVASAESTPAELNDIRKLYAYTDMLRENITRFKRGEEAMLEARMDVLQQALVTQRRIRYACFILIGITSLLALMTLMKRQREHDDLIKQLNTTNENLENKVRDRTLELERKNQLAEKLNRDLQENFETLELFYEALQVKNVKTEDTLREIQYLYDNANCAYHSIDTNGKIVRINQTELNWLQYKREEVIGKLTFKDILVPEEHAVFDKKFSQFLRDGYIRNIKYHYRRKDGSTFPVLLNATAIYDKDNNITMSRATVIDISEQEEAEKQLIIFNQKLKALNEEKDNFLGAAAHDLKSPLNGILGLINLLKKDSANLNVAQNEYIRYIEQSCSNMKIMVTNLLDINRIEQGVNSLTLAKFSLRELMQHQLQMFKEASERKNISLIFDDHDEEIFMYSDPALVRRISDNLISNAIKFSFPQGTVRVTIRPQDETVSLEVKDFGPGINKDEMPLLFNKFKRLTPRPTAGESSTGLGLSIVKELVHVLQGKIGVSSEENVGTTFTVALPMSIVANPVRESSEVQYKVL